MKCYSVPVQLIKEVDPDMSRWEFNLNIDRFYEKLDDAFHEVVQRCVEELNSLSIETDDMSFTHRGVVSYVKAPNGIGYKIELKIADGEGTCAYVGTPYFAKE